MEKETYGPEAETILSDMELRAQLAEREDKITNLANYKGAGMSLNAKEEQWVRVQVKKHDTELKNLHLLAEAVLEAHFQIATSHKCQCEACTVAREVMDDCI